jgi:hypothetical protein
MGSNPEALAELQRQAAERKQQDYINTNILNSNDPALQIAQDAVIGLAVGQAVDAVTIDVLKKNLINSLEGRAVELPFKNTRRVLKVGPKALKTAIDTVTKQSTTKSMRAAKILTNSPKILKEVAASVKASLQAAKAAEKAAQAATKAAREAALAAKEAAKVASAAAKIGTKVGVKAGEVMAQSAVKGAMMMGAICAASGAETAGVGCLVGIAVMVLELAFDAFNLAMDIIDPNGYSVVIYKKDIELVAQTTGEWVNSEYGKDKPNYLDEEVFFDWESHLYEIDDQGNITVNDEWATQYEKYRDEYMTSIGITGDWRSRLQSTSSANANDPGVMSPLTLTFQEYKKEADSYLNNKKSKSSILLFVVILFVTLFLTFIIFFFII